ncbi:hypothetical protein SAMN04489712_13220 [Thermomonospora echinospora]|uniref:Uncharacterized protein n=1 Tax=Thermomonospora echinospora TaxID=1992 RepID=A0A1H6E387_9ACTN|nr:hypothetical protein [Thermomonospora echinospora]SEG92092.1 hypothetical protein SAMN04489712_13220 [Thermomonospora echinospora]
MSLNVPSPFLTVAYGAPVNIGFLPQDPADHYGRLLTVGWTAKLGTSFLPHDPDDELIDTPNPSTR